MKTNDLLKAVKNFVDSNRRERMAKYDSLKRLMKKLKTKQNSLKEKINKESDNKIKVRLEEELKVLKAQRKKGLRLLKELKSEL